MNPILSFAIEHQAKAKAILVASYGVAYDDVEDVSQNMLVGICQAAPQQATNPRGYWSRTLQMAAYAYRQRDAHQPLSEKYDRPDPRQDVEATAIRHELLRDAWTEAMPAERRAIVQILTDPIPRIPGKTRVPLCRLRRRLRGRAAA